MGTTVVVIVYIFLLDYRIYKNGQNHFKLHLDISLQSSLCPLLRVHLPEWSSVSSSPSPSLSVADFQTSLQYACILASANSLESWISGEDNFSFRMISAYGEEGGESRNIPKR